MTAMADQKLDAALAGATLPVSELFGPTLQGEGPHAGRAVQFLRMMGCNLSCSWCDTPYTWDGSRYDLRRETQPMTVAEILDRLLPGVPLVLSGGEPLLHQAKPPLQAVLQHARLRLGCEIHVETNGTIAPNDALRSAVTAFAVSPKLGHAGPHRGHQDARMAAIWPSVPGAFLKVVVRDAEDVAEAVALAERQGWDRRAVWVMPLGTTTAGLLARWPGIASAAADAGINATQRLHVLAWGDTKGT